MAEGLGLHPKACVTRRELLSPNGHLYKQRRETVSSSDLFAVFQVTAFSPLSPVQKDSGATG